MRPIRTVDELEKVVGGRPLPSMLKTIDHLDDHCARILAASPVAVLGHQEPGGGVRASVVGGPRGFATADTPTLLALPLPEGVAPAPGSPLATVFLVPGLGETLRVNGHVDAIADGRLGLAVDEVFLHCAKCVIRSRLWDQPPAAGDSSPVTGSPAEAGDDGVGHRAGGNGDRSAPVDGPLAADGVADLLARSPFVVLTSCDAHGHADASPKGDPAGFVHVLDGRRVAIPDRPGNKRTDTWHNLVERPEIALLAVVPGDDRVVELSGTGSLTDDTDLRASMAVGGRTPKVALVIDVERAWVRPSAELADASARIWGPLAEGEHVDPPDIARAFVDHVKRNRSRGLAAKAARAVVNERTMRAGLAHDYKRNLY